LESLLCICFFSVYFDEFVVIVDPVLSRWLISFQMSNSHEASSSTAIVSVIFNILRIFNTVTIDTHCQLQSKLKEETQQSAYLCQIVVTGEQQMH